MFNVAFVKYVFDSDHEDTKARFVVLSREESLPFAPTPGQEIQWPMIRSQRILTSTWSTEHQGFRCRVEDEYAINLRLDAADFDECVEQATDEGWNVGSIYPATK